MDDSQIGDSANITLQARQMDTKFPQVAAILKKHGFASREYLLALYAFIQSSIIVGMKKSGQVADPEKLNGIVNPANIELLEKNWDEISKLNLSPQ